MNNILTCIIEKMQRIWKVSREKFSEMADFSPETVEAWRQWNDIFEVPLV